jgi:predicted GNAT family acetyltransferase
MITITDDSEKRRFELLDDGQLAAFVVYGRNDGMIALTHTETLDGFGGQGYASRLVEHVLGMARDQGQSVLPFCPFVTRYMSSHPETIDLVPERYLDNFGLRGTAAG